VSYYDEPLVDDLLKPDEVELRRTIRAVVAAEVAPLADVTHRGRPTSPRAFAALRSYCGLLLPQSYGGTGSSTVAYALAVEEIARGCASTSLTFVTQTHAAYPILLKGTEEQRYRYLPGLANGTLLGALAITEPDAGSDAASLRTRAQRDGDTYVLDGSKTFITTGDRADVIVLFATVDRSRGRDGVTAFLLPGDAPGLDRSRTIEKLGMHGSSTATLHLDGVRLPASARLGDEGSAWALSMATVVKSRISAAAQGLGIAASAYAISMRWAAGHGLLRGSNHQAVQFRLSDLRTRIQSARLQLHAVARSVDFGGRDHTADVAMAKTTCTDLGFHAANTAMDLHGMAGTLDGCGVERLLRDVVVTQIYDGTNEIQRLLVARDAADRLDVNP